MSIFTPVSQQERQREELISVKLLVGFEGAEPTASAKPFVLQAMIQNKVIKNCIDLWIRSREEDWDRKT